MIFNGRSGMKYSVIEPAIGKGGEGSVYRITGMPLYVLKVFSDSKRTETRHRKLLAMISTPLSKEAMQQVAWPIDIVYENNGKFAGYIMPLISNNEDLNVMYSDKYICTFLEKIIIARNLCAAINSVHNAGQVCGDLNPKNIGVDPNSARITLLDTDSYHINEKNSGRIYRCEVGLPEYLPREIQEKMRNGMTLANASLPTFSQSTDLFALAVHIFALLMNGSHPFACATNSVANINHLSISQSSVTAPQPIENICNGFFPFYQKRSGITTPRYAPEFAMLPKNIQNLFIRAFVNGHNSPSLRPDTVEWYNALVDLEKNLLECTNEKTHIYPKHLTKCPWCELNQRLNHSIISTSNTPNIQQPNTNHTQVGTSNNYNNPSVNATPKKSSSGGYGVQNHSHKISEADKSFWLVTVLLSLGIQAAAHILTNNMIASYVFGTEYGDALEPERWAINLAIWLGPWGFVIFGLIGVWIYNIRWSPFRRTNNYEWYHYTLSVLCSVVFSAGWILFILILTLAIILIIGALIIAAICGALSGS